MRRCVRARLLHAATGIAISLLGTGRTLASPFYSVVDLGTSTAFQAQVPESIGIDSQGKVSITPSGGLNFGNSASGPVPAGDQSYYSVAKSSDNGLYTAGKAYNPASHQFDGYIVSGGKATLLSPIELSVPGSSPMPFAVNNSGQAVGEATWANAAGGIMSGATISTPGKGSQLITPAGGDAYAINNLGKVVGSYIPQPQISAQTDAFLWNGGRLYDLNTLIPSGSGWKLTTAMGINDKGQIVAYGTDASGQYHALLLNPADPNNVGPTTLCHTRPPTPAPEPSTLAFVGLVVLGLAARRAWTCASGHGG